MISYNKEEREREMEKKKRLKGGVEKKRKLGGGRGEDLYSGMEPEVTSVALKATGMVEVFYFLLGFN